jgi:hypothetical protein
MTSTHGPLPSTSFRFLLHKAARPATTTPHKPPSTAQNYTIISAPSLPRFTLTLTVRSTPRAHIDSQTTLQGETTTLRLSRGQSSCLHNANDYEKPTFALLLNKKHSYPALTEPHFLRETPHQLRHSNPSLCICSALPQALHIPQLRPYPHY